MTEHILCVIDIKTVFASMLHCLELRAIAGPQLVAVIADACYCRSHLLAEACYHLHAFNLDSKES